MAFDPDANPDADYEAEQFSSALDELEDRKLGDWDREFVEDLLKRVQKTSPLVVVRALTARQQEQFERIKEQYHVRERYSRRRP